jgi:5-methyltetrahydropteroyltriglutamate--homocysteine methyltransferase
MTIPTVTHVGSFIRPINLLEKRKLLLEKLCTVADLRTCEDDAIRELVAFQKELGLKTITDGEFRR